MRIILMLIVVLLPLDLVAKGAGGLAALRTRMNLAVLPKVNSACADGKVGWRDSDSKALRLTLEKFGWKERHYDTPDWDCSVRVELLCAPDLDGDAQKDFLVRLSWKKRTKSTVGKDCAALPGDHRELIRHEAVIVANRDGKTWKAVDLVDFNADVTIDGMAHARVDFVELPDGKVGLRCKTQTENTGGGCKVLGYWVGAMVDGRVKKVAEADPEFCVPD